MPTGNLPIALALGALLLTLSAVEAPAQKASSTADDFHAAWDLPDDPIGRRLGHFLEVMKRDDEAFTREFLENWLHPSFLEMGPVSVHLEQFAIIRQSLGRFTVDDVRIAGPYRVDAVLAGDDGTRTLLHIEIEEVEPHRLAGINLQPYDADLEIPEFKDLAAAHAYLKGLAEANKFSGVVLVDRPDQPLSIQTYGMASKEKGIRNRPGTSFNVGSITKSFTAVAVMKLVEQGKVSLDDPMSKYLPSFPREIADRVTVRHLLRMESGYGDYFGSPKFEARRERIRTIDDLLDILKDQKLAFEPGTDSQYSNTGCVILGGIIEAASGTTYFEFVDRHIFQPVGMTGSGFPDYAAADEGIAMGYTNDGDHEARDYTRTYLDLFTPRGNPSGGSFSSAEDLLKFNRALWANELLSEANTTRLLNFFAERPGRPSRRGIAGGAPGVSAVNYQDVKHGVTVIVLSNYDEPFGERVGEAIFRMLVGSS